MRLLIFEIVAKNNRNIFKKEPFWLMCVPWCSTSFTPCLIKIGLINLNSVKVKGVFSGLWSRIPLQHHPHSHTPIPTCHSPWHHQVFSFLAPFSAEYGGIPWSSGLSASLIRVQAHEGQVLVEVAQPFLPVCSASHSAWHMGDNQTPVKQTTNYLNESMFLKVGIKLWSHLFQGGRVHGFLDKIFPFGQ